MKISVVIPTFHRPQLLQRCLLAIKEQSFNQPDYEIIIVSDGPDEITNDIISKSVSPDHRFIYLQMPTKKGPAAARNLGWQNANGILIAFTDDDTIPDKEWLQNLWQAYKGEEEIAYTGSIKVPLSTSPTDYEKNTAGLETADFVTANCCCTKIALEKTGGFDERFSMAWREDSDLEFKLLTHQIPIVHVPDALVVHPVRQAPWGISIKEQKKGMFNALLYKKYPQLYRQKMQTSPPWNYYVMIIAIAFFLAAIVTKTFLLAFTAFVVWLVLFVDFLARRLKHTSKARAHIVEMIVTSLCIPFIAVYWQLYGAWRYKVFFL